jgi:flagellar biosynthesis GTPase FlhF
MTTTTEPLRAFHGEQEVKDRLLARIGAHEKADAIIGGTYGTKKGGVWKACAVGCSVHDLTEDDRAENPHARYPDLLGLPEWVAYLEDRIFEGLPTEKQPAFPRRFAAAIPVGADFDGFADRLAIRRLKEECLPLSGSWPESIRAQVVASIEQTIAALEGKGDREAAARSARSAESAARSAAWSAARSAARSARSAESAARSAESAAESAESAARSAESAAESAARSAESAAWSAARSAESAARSAESAARSAESAARSAARSAAYEREADRLIAELEALPVPVAA